MAGNNVVANLVLRLVDQVSDPAKGVAGSLKNLGNVAGKQSLQNRRANLLSPEGGALAIARMKALDKETARFGKRYEIAAAKNGKSWSTNLAATSAMIAAQGKALDSAGRKAATTATHFRATSAAAHGAMYTLSKVQRAPLSTVSLGPVTPSETSRRAAEQGKQRASTWVAAQGAAAGAAAAASRGGGGGGGDDEDGKRRGRRVGGVAGGVGAGGTAAAVWTLAKKRAEAERRMTRAAISAGLEHGRVPGEVSKTYAEFRQQATDMGVEVGFIQDGFEALITLGRSWEEARREARTVAQAAHTYDTSAEDMARTLDTVAENLDMKSGSDREAGLKSIVGGGRSGTFEIKDVAKNFPELAPKAKAAGYKGNEHLQQFLAKLQLINERTNNASTTTTQMSRLLDELNSPQAQKRFQKAGVNLTEGIERGVKEGKTRLDAYLDVLRKATGGDENNLNKYIVNTQARDGARALLNLQSYLEKIKEVAERSQTGLEQDAKLLDDHKKNMESFGRALGDLGDEIGKVAVKATPFVQRLTDSFRLLSGNMSNEEREKVLKNRTKSSDPVTRFWASRSLTELEKRMGRGRDFTLGQPGHRLSPTGIPVENGGFFQPSDSMNRLATKSIEEGMKRSPLPSVRSGRVTGQAGLYPGALSPGSISAAPFLAPTSTMPGVPPLPPMRPKVDKSELDSASNVFDHINTMLDEVNGKTTTPHINAESIKRAHDLLREFLNDLNRADQGMKSLGSGAQKTLQPGGRVREAFRAGNFDQGS
ncbi:MAG: phage tail tape measure protein [Beijerinckiaceae bacterium]|nr:phage tail tape measure protein [Beijerinckiaceae bacterium]